MGRASPSESGHGLPPGEQRPGEKVLDHWPAPGGRGLLTNLRCLLLGHPHPVHRPVLWTTDLESVRSLSVATVPGEPGLRIDARGTFGGGSISTGDIDPTFVVLTDETMVFVGYPDACGQIQQRIDAARTDRCVALFGRVVPYDGPVLRSLTARAAPTDPAAGAPSRAPEGTGSGS